MGGCNQALLPRNPGLRLVMDAGEFDLEDELALLADRLCAALGWRGVSALDRAVALDRIIELAGVLRDEQVRLARRRLSWVSVAKRFGVSRQAASKRWGP